MSDRDPPAIMTNQPRGNFSFFIRSDAQTIKIAFSTVVSSSYPKEEKNRLRCRPKYLRPRGMKNRKLWPSICSFSLLSDSRFCSVVRYFRDPNHAEQASMLVSFLRLDLSLDRTSEAQDCHPRRILSLGIFNHRKDIFSPSHPRVYPISHPQCSKKSDE